MKKSGSIPNYKQSAMLGNYEQLDPYGDELDEYSHFNDHISKDDLDLLDQYGSEDLDINLSEYEYDQEQQEI